MRSSEVTRTWRSASSRSEAPAYFDCVVCLLFMSFGFACFYVCRLSLAILCLSFAGPPSTPIAATPPTTTTTTAAAATTTAT